jgi:hypothetical protein
MSSSYLIGGEPSLHDRGIKKGNDRGSYHYLLMSNVSAPSRSVAPHYRVSSIMTVLSFFKITPVNMLTTSIFASAKVPFHLFSQLSSSNSLLLNPAPLPHRIDDVVIILKFPYLIYQTINSLTTFFVKEMQGSSFYHFYKQGC